MTAPLYDARPNGEPRGAVIVFQEAFGVNPHIEDVTRRFAAVGYRAVAPHLFHRTGAPVLDYGDREAIVPHMQALARDTLLEDVDAALDALAREGFAPERVATVGFCMGGSVSFYTAVERPVGAAVTFYGGGVAEGRFGMPPQLEVAGQLRAPWLGLYGDEDPSIPVADVERLRERVSAAPAQTQIVRYPGAGHGFHCDQRASYVEAAAKDAWERTLDWVAQHVE